MTLNAIKNAEETAIDDALAKRAMDDEDVYKRQDQLRYQVVPVELAVNGFIEERLECLEGFAYSKNIKLVFQPGEEDVYKRQLKTVFRSAPAVWHRSSMIWSTKSELRPVFPAEPISSLSARIVSVV